MNVIKYSGKLFFSLALAILLVSGCKVSDQATSNKSNDPNDTSEKDSFVPEHIPSGSKTAYDIHLNMSNDGQFQVDVKVNVENTSKDAWNELVFYFIPNIFTEKTQTELSRSLASPGTVNVQEVVIGDEKVEYTLDKDTLRIPLKSPVANTDVIGVEFKYEMTLPENGLRFAKKNGNYHLAQFYPMLATYRDHEWNKEDYRFRGETYHTDFSDFNLTYQLPEEYTIVTTSPNDGYPTTPSVRIDVVGNFSV